MLKNYLKIAWRNISQNAAYTIFNITGLAIGLAVFIVTLLYVNNETSYDKWDKQLERVYRVGVSQTSDGESSDMFWTAFPLGTQLVTTCPEAGSATRMAERGEQLITYGENSFYEKQVIMADSFFFKVFPYKFIEGSRLTALNKPYTAVITTAMAKKIFGNTSAVGKTIEISAAWTGKQTYEVTGVIEKTGPSHLNFNVCLYHIDRDPGYWGRQIYTTYVLLKPGASVAALAEKAKTIYLNNQAAYLYKELSAGNSGLAAPGNQPAEWLKTNNKLTNVSVFFEQAKDIHLNPRAGGWRDAAANHPVLDAEAGNDMPVIYFSIAAILVLLLACINYTNLSIARAGKRAKETGMRKVMGAGRRQLIFQFLCEAFLQCLAALLLALLLAAWLTGIINRTFNLQLQLWDALLPRHNFNLVGQLVLIVVAVALLSGTYPAFILSSFRAARVLKGDISKNMKGSFLRNGLVVLQFAISACFIISLGVIYMQLRYMRTNNPGFATEQVLVLKPANTDLISSQQKGGKLDYIKNRLMQIPGVELVTVSDAFPGSPSVDVQQAMCKNVSLDMSFHYVYYNYFKALNMPILKGRDFSEAYASDSINTAIINETAARKLGIKNPVGEKVNIMLQDYTIIGVLKDNYEAGYNTAVAPALYAIGARPGLLNYSTMLVKVKSNNTESTATAIQNTWKTIEPAFPLKYSWLDEDFATLISRYERFGRITTMLGIVSLLIALLGIFALSAFTARQRTREIGIRKVFGATVTNITTMLSKSFILMVAIALVIAFPVAHWLMSKWLQGFAYRIHITWLVFAVTGIAIVFLALITVSVQAIRAATASPVKSLRTE